MATGLFEVFRSLAAGEVGLADDVRNAAPEMLNFLDGLRKKSVDEVATELGAAQIRFEGMLGGQFPGKLIYPWLAYAVLVNEDGYFEQNKELAIKLSQAFPKSSVSLEVHSAAEKAAQYFSLV